jgi:hypothetical protein
MTQRSRCADYYSASHFLRPTNNPTHDGWIMQIAISSRKLLLLLFYSALVTALMIGALLGRVTAAPQIQRIDELDVQRLNLREADGTLRLVIANRSRLPGVIVKGKEQPAADRPQAGMLFYNDEGSEAGGLIFSGRQTGDGRIENAGGSLSFDQYGGNQIVQLIGVHDATDHIVGLLVSDTDPGGNRRVFVGNEENGTARMALMDRKGRTRISLEVAADGTPSLTFLDGEGKVVQRLSPASPR